jgi:cytochrome c553
VKKDGAQGARRKGWRGEILATFFFCSAAFATPAPDVIAACEACHGKGGNSTTPLTPSIAGQPPTFLENQLIFFREGLRASSVMQGIAKGMKDKEIAELAKHFAASPVKIVSPGAPDPKLDARGRQLAGGMHCGQCHLPDYRGRAQMPRLAGQREDYLVETMKAYRDGKRTGADTTMSEVLYSLNDADIKALGHFLARRK